MNSPKFLILREIGNYCSFTFFYVNYHFHLSPVIDNTASVTDHASKCAWVYSWAFYSLVCMPVLSLAHWMMIACKMFWYLEKRTCLAWPHSPDFPPKLYVFFHWILKINLWSLGKTLFDWVLFHLSIDLQKIDIWSILYCSLHEHGIPQY